MDGVRLSFMASLLFWGIWVRVFGVVGTGAGGTRRVECRVALGVPRVVVTREERELAAHHMWEGQSGW